MQVYQTDGQGVYVGVALADYDKSKPDVLSQRQAWRVELRTLEV
jgi:hypothetical protein